MGHGFAGLRKTFARPLLEPGEAIGAIVGLPGFVIFTADYQNVAIFVALNANVVIRIERVPVQSAPDGSFWNRRADYVSYVRRLFRMDRDAIVHGRVGSYDDCLASYHWTSSGFDARVLSTFRGDEAAARLADVLEDAVRAAHRRPRAA